MKTLSLRQSATFQAAPQDVYDLLMNARKHGKLIGSKVTMSARPNGKFETYDGYVHGHNIELSPGKRIVQAWHFKEDGWPDDHYSVCTFVFSKDGTKTHLAFKQTGIPAHKLEDLKGGWKKWYWEPMKAALAKRRTTKAL